MAKRNKWRTKEAVKIAENAGLGALRDGADAFVLTEAIDEAPVLSGTLRRSGTVTVGRLPDAASVYEAAKAGKNQRNAFQTEQGKEKAVYVSFNTPYSRRQHEELGYNHPGGGGPKFLENPTNRNRKKIVKYVDKEIKKALRKSK